MTNLRRHRSALVLLTALGSGGCVPDFETDLSALRAPRLLAISSSPAETQAGKPITLSALVAVPEGQTAPDLDWTACLSRKPLTELGAVSPLCLQPDDGTGAVLDLGRGASVTATLDQEACKLFGPLRPSPKPGESSGRPVDPDITGGFYQPVVANLDGVPSLGSVRIDCDPANLNRDDALAFRAQYRVNENPRLSSVAISAAGASSQSLDLASDVPTELKAGDAIGFRAAWNDCPTESSCGDGLCTANEDNASCKEDCAPGMARGCTGSEHYVWYNRESYRVEPRREGIAVAWYASKGHFEREQTGLDEEQAAARQNTSNTWRLGGVTGPATVWVVVRDTRGGQSWQTLRFVVSP